MSTQRSVFAVLTLALTCQVWSPSSQATTESGPTEPQQQLEPAKRYSGATPIDLSHGGFGNNGIYGIPDPAYTQMAQAPLLAPGVLAAPYPFERKQAFIAGIADRLSIYDDAILNLKERSSITRPEAVAFADQAIPKIENLLKQARAALAEASSAGKDAWPSAEQAARAAFASLQGTYQDLNSAK